MRNFLPLIIKLSLGIWILSIITFFGSVYFATDGFKTLMENTQFGKSLLFPLIILISMAVGALFFLLLIFAFFIQSVIKYKLLEFEPSFKGALIFSIKLLFLIPIFPLFLLFKLSKIEQAFKIKKRDQLRVSFNINAFRTFLGRVFSFLAVLVTLVPVWIGGYFLVGKVAAYQLGYTPEDILIVGTGSMYPTWPKGTKGKSPKDQAKEIVGRSGFFRYPNGIEIAGKRYFNHIIARGDIVTAENDAIRKVTEKTYGTKSGVLKRVIAIGGDILELKDGIVYLNDKALKESYIAKARSTFGENFLKECQKITIPKDFVFLMGDNRKGSGDSREFGFVKLSEIKYVLPLEKQKGTLDKNWHDSANDLSDQAKIKLDKNKYLQLINHIRTEEGSKPLKYQPKLEQSALKRGQVMFKYDDFSYEATRSGYTQEKAMADAGYSNIIWNEGIIQGHFEAEELVDYFQEFPQWKKFILEKDMQEMGISEIEGLTNNCPNKVIVQHFAGYLPPHYKKEDLESWRKVIDNLGEIIPSWESAKGNNYFNQGDLNRLFSLFYREKEIAQKILSKMETNQWLTREEEAMIEESSRISKESSELSRELNTRQ